MDRGAWQAMVHRSQGVGHDWATEHREDWKCSAGSWVPRDPGIWKWPHSVPTRTLTLVFHTCLAENWTFFGALLPLWLSPGPGPPFALPSGGDSDGKESACNMRDVGLIPELGRSPRGGHGSPLQYFCWRIPMDRGAWWATVHGVTKSWTWLSN